MAIDLPRRYACRACGRAHARWAARCLHCGKLGLVPLDADPPQVSSMQSIVIPARLVEQSPPSSALPTADAVPSLGSMGLGLDEPVPDDDPAAAPIPLSDVEEATYRRERSGLPSLDDVCGGGLVCGGVYVLGGEPGCGKSSLLGQWLDGLGMRCLYATGEESIAQAAARARRINAASSRVFIVAESRLEVVLAHAEKLRAEVLAIDSIQTLVCDELDSGPGSPGQVKACANRLVQFAKATDVAIVMIGHVTSDSALAGPRTLQHLVDAVLMLEDRGGDYRVLRATKNRFGRTGVEGWFLLGAEGLEALAGPPVLDDERDEPVDDGAS